MIIKKGVHKTEVRLVGEELFLGSDYDQESIDIQEFGIFVIVHVEYTHQYEAIVGGFFEESGETLLVIDTTLDKIVSNNENMSFRRSIERLS